MTQTTEFTVQDLKIARKRLGMNQQALSNALHVALGTVAAWEQGRQGIPGPAVVAIRYMLTEARN